MLHKIPKVLEEGVLKGRFLKKPQQLWESYSVFRVATKIAFERRLANDN
jgi:hypothetical protein